jgi:hypothetical protein
MLDIKGTFRVNKIRVFKSNIQYQLIFLKDRVLFIKIGGQFADGGLGSTITSSIGSTLGGGIGGAIGHSIGQEIESKYRRSAAKKDTRK